ANPDMDVARDRGRLDRSSHDRFEVLIARDGVRVDGRRRVSDPEVAGHELRIHVASRALDGDVARGGLDLRLAADFAERDVAARRLDLDAPERDLEIEADGAGSVEVPGRHQTMCCRESA